MSSIPLKTVQRRIRASREAVLFQLVRKVHADAGQSRRLGQDLVLLIEAWRRQKLQQPLTSIHALVRQVVQE